MSTRHVDRPRALLGPALTPREREVVQTLVVCDGDTKRAAEALCVTYTTVKTHVRNAMGRKGVGSRFGLLAAAIRDGEVTV